MRPLTATNQSPVKAALALAVSTALAASLALAAPATAQAKTVKAPAKVKKPTVSKVKATSFKVTWKKAKRAKGYQVKVLKGSKTVKTITVKKRSCYATGLSSKTTYKVKVRAYNKSGKKVKYGKWSAARSVTTTKSVADAKADSYAWMHGGSSSKTHTHSWSADSCVGGSTRIYYCLQCGKLFKTKTDLESHANNTNHLQQTSGGSVYEDGVRVSRSSSVQGEYAYSYITLKNTSLFSASYHCSCGATRAHTHTWKRLAQRYQEKVITSRWKCGCGWISDYIQPGIDIDEQLDKHESDTNCKRGFGNDEMLGYSMPWVPYSICSDCGLVKMDWDQAGI